MFILYYGGQKSGKSKLAEAKTITLSQNHKPYYIATYDHSYKDIQMQQKIDLHKKQRGKNFITIEEPLNIVNVIKPNQTYLIDCISMLILNHLENFDSDLLSQLEKLSTIDANIVFVLNDVNNGIIPIDKQTRKFVDHTGIIGQYLASICDEVYEVKLGIPLKLK